MTVVDTGPREEGDLDEGSAAEHIHGICLKTGPPRRVGVELEWLVRDARDPALPVAAGRTASAVSAFGATRDSRDTGAGPVSIPAQKHGNTDKQRNTNGDTHVRAELPTSLQPGVLPSGAPLTAEPGGQLEISSLPADSLADLVQATSTDLAALRTALAGDGLELAGIGLDPLRPPRRVLDLPRYAAMEGFFDSWGPWGREMMCGTASVQVCLDAGDDSDGPGGYRWRWRLVHALGPVLVAAFANSPLRDGRPTGWVSSRQQVWSRMDPGRTRPPRLAGDPRAAWADYALDARLMCVRGSDNGDWSAPPGLTLRDWVRGRWPRTPTADDLEYHLSTLFPPVRPRGHFELRMIDAQPGADGWIVPLAVCWALLSEPRAGDAALDAVTPLWGGQPPGGAGAAGGRTGEPAAPPGSPQRPAGAGPWLRAARLGPSDPATSRASRACFAAARAAMDRSDVPAGITAAVDAFIDSYVSKDRCPADDLLEEAT
jgi:glutamate--cysteine ligase